MTELVDKILAFDLQIKNTVHCGGTVTTEKKKKPRKIKSNEKQMQKKRKEMPLLLKEI